VFDGGAPLIKKIAIVSQKKPFSRYSILNKALHSPTERTESKAQKSLQLEQPRSSLQPSFAQLLLLKLRRTHKRVRGKKLQRKRMIII
jgi:hypothetical protein